MKLYTFEVVIERESEGEGYVAYCPTLSGCFRSGRTLEETRQKLEEAVTERVRSLLAGGEAVPQSQGRRRHVETLAIALREGADGRD